MNATITTTKLIGRLLLPAMFLWALQSSAMNDALKIKIIGNGYSDETVIYFTNGATESFDGDFDAWKLFSLNNNVPSIYTRIDTASPLSINAFPELNINYSFDLYTVINKAGSYSINANELGTFATGVSITLLDLQTGFTYNLRDTSLYSFSLPVSTAKSAARFRISFSLPLTTNLNKITDSHLSFFVYQTENELNVKFNTKGSNEKIIITLFNTNGQLVETKEISNEMSGLALFSIQTAGTYIFRLQHNNQVYSTITSFLK